MYMTVLKADYQSLQSRKFFMDLNDMYFVHKWITSQVGQKQKDAGIKFRVDKTKDAFFLYIQSENEFPTHNVSSAGMNVVNIFELSKPSGKIAFRLKANTIRQASGNVTAHLNTDEERKAWARKRLEPYIADLQISVSGTGIISTKNNLKCFFTEFNGSGYVKDPEAFYQIVNNGVGRSKAFGMGLLLYKEIA